MSKGKIKPGLLACPFCGTIPNTPIEASVYSHSYFDKGNCGLTASVNCHGCGIFVLGKKVKSTDKLACKEAARVWNKRVI
jgi:hypothetical protein